MFSKRNKKLGVIVVWFVTITMILMYVPLIFTPKSQVAPVQNSAPIKQQLEIPITPRINSSSTATSTL